MYPKQESSNSISLPQAQSESSYQDPLNYFRLTDVLPDSPINGSHSKEVFPTHQLQDWEHIKILFDNFTQVEVQGQRPLPSGYVNYFLMMLSDILTMYTKQQSLEFVV